MLLARLAHDAQKTHNNEVPVLLPNYEAEEAKIAAGDGVEAARTAARILQLQMDEQAIFQRCWNCEFVYLPSYPDVRDTGTDNSCRFSAYMASLLLLHSAAHMQLHEYPPRVWQNELSYAKTCIDVLKYCGEADKVAARFGEISRGYYDTLAFQAESVTATDTVHTPRNFDYLFSVPSSSPDYLVQASCDLLNRVSCPFDSPPSLHNEGTLRAGLGTHTTLPFNRSPVSDARPWSAVEKALSSMPTGHFHGSSQPHGWDMFLNFKVL